MRGLEAFAALPPSENHVRGDFKNIPIMLQDKSLITGNYGLPISSPSHPKSPRYFYPLIQQETQPGRGKLEWLREGRGGEAAITWEQTLIMAADALLHFYSCGVAHLWAAITDQMIQTGPCDEVKLD